MYNVYFFAVTLLDLHMYNVYVFVVTLLDLHMYVFGDT